MHSFFILIIENEFAIESPPPPRSVNEKLPADFDLGDLNGVEIRLLPG